MSTHPILSQIPERFPLEQHEGEIAPLVDWLATRPPLHVVVEIGVRHGGSSALWCLLADTLVVGVDRRGHDSLQGSTYTTRAEDLAGTYGQYRFVDGDSHDRRTRLQVEMLVAPYELVAPYQVDLLYLDGDHSLAGVTQDYQDYGRLVRPGGIILFHDITSAPSTLTTEYGVAEFWSMLERVTPPQQLQRFSLEADWGGLGAIIV